MPRTIIADGKSYVVPDDATDDEINSIVGPPPIGAKIGLGRKNKSMGGPAGKPIPAEEPTTWGGKFLNSAIGGLATGGLQMAKAASEPAETLANIGSPLMGIATGDPDILGNMVGGAPWAAMGGGGVPEGTGAVLKGAAKGAWREGMSPSTLNVRGVPVGIPVPKSIASGGIGYEVGRHFPGIDPTFGGAVGGVVGATIPPIRGAIRGGIDAYREYNNLPPLDTPPRAPLDKPPTFPFQPAWHGGEEAPTKTPLDKPPTFPFTPAWSKAPESIPLPKLDTSPTFPFTPKWSAPLEEPTPRPQVKPWPITPQWTESGTGARVGAILPSEESGGYSTTSPVKTQQVPVNLTTGTSTLPDVESPELSPRAARKGSAIDAAATAKDNAMADWAVKNGITSDKVTPGEGYNSLSKRANSDLGKSYKSSYKADDPEHLERLREFKDILDRKWALTQSQPPDLNPMQ